MSDSYELLADIVNHIDTDSPDRIYRSCGEMLNVKEQVVHRFQPIFSPSNINQLTAEDYRAFLKWENNRHWTGLPRAKYS